MSRPRYRVEITRFPDRPVHATRGDIWKTYGIFLSDNKSDTAELRMQAAADAPVSHAEKKVRLSEPEPGQDEDDERSDADSVVDEEGTALDPIMEKILAVVQAARASAHNDPIDKDMIRDVITEISPDNLGVGGQAIVHVLREKKWKAANDPVHYCKSWRTLGGCIAAALGDESDMAYMDYYIEREFDDELTHALVDKARDVFEKKGLKITWIQE
jgi:hypothetical protein